MKAYNVCLVLCVLLSFGACKRCVTKGYQGKDCDQEVSPKSIVLESIDFRYENNFNDHLDGGNDNGPGGKEADLYLVIKNGSQVLFQSNYRTDNGRASYMQFSRQLDNPLEITNPSSAITFELWDKDDTGADDLIGTADLLLYKEGANFPRIISQQTDDYTLALNVLAYTFDQ